MTVVGKLPTSGIMFCAACDEKGDPAEFQLTAKFVAQATLSDFEVST